MRAVWREMARVAWPTRDSTIHNALLIAAAVVGVAAAIAALDIAFGHAAASLVR